MNALTPIVAVGSYPAAPTRPTAVWSGRPDWTASLVRIWKVGWVAAWFAALLADGLRLAVAAAAGPARALAWAGEERLALVAAVVLLGLLALAALTRRSTRYTIEARSVTLRYGLALPATLVIPFAAIAQVDVRTHRDGTGDVALRLKPGQGVIYPKLWPHARPWRWMRAEPMLRCVPDAGVAAALLCRALAARDRIAAE